MTDRIPETEIRTLVEDTLRPTVRPTDTERRLALACRQLLADRDDAEERLQRIAENIRQAEDVGLRPNTAKLYALAFQDMRRI